ncbi:hypothetical protein D3C79_738450 [compost metagenome]
MPQNQHRAIVRLHQLGMPQTPGYVQPIKTGAQRRQQMFQLGMKDRALRHRHQIAGRRLAKPHRQLLLFGLPHQPQTSAATVSVLRAGDHRLLLWRNAGFAGDHAHQCGRFALLLQTFIRMLLLAATANAKVRATRLHALRAAAQQTFQPAFGKLAFFFRQLDFRLLARQHSRHKHRFAVVARHALAKGIEVAHRYGEYL